MRIQNKDKFVFISTPKACTHTIYNILEEHYSEGLSKAGFHNNKVRPQHKDYYRWTVVRNPFERAVSIWWSGCRLAHLDQYKFRKESGTQYDFTKFIIWLADVPKEKRWFEPLMMNQSEWLDPAEPIQALHLENLEKELPQLSFWKEGIDIPQLNTTTEKIEVQSEAEGQTIVRPSMSELYKDEEAFEAVLKWAGPDFDRFGYLKRNPSG